MITNNQIKFVKSLHQNKFRQKYNNFIAEGDKIAQEIIKSSSYVINHIFANDDWIENNKDLCSNYQEIIVSTDKRSMDKISALKTSSPVLVVLKKNSECIHYDNINTSHSIYLADVQDPGNMGTIIRVADWFGIKTVVRSRASADFFHPRVIQSTMGSFINVDLLTAEFDDISATLKVPTVGATMNGEVLSSYEWPSACMLVMGNESKGISTGIENQLNHHITIAGDKNRVAESLNVGMATGIILSSMCLK